jgi:PAS domain S-box-containing protein
MNKKYQILIFDDDHTHGEVLRIYLEALLPCVADWVGNCVEFWESMKRTDYDLLFLDYHLGGVTGLEIMDQMRLRSYGTPVVMITGEGNEQIAAQALQQGAVDYLVKGSFSLPRLPELTQKAIESVQLHRMAEQSFEQIRYQAMLLNNIREALVVWDLEGKITFWNPAAMRLFGWLPDEMVGRPVTEAYYRLFDPAMRVPGIEDSGGFDIERRCQTKSGDMIWVSGQTSVLRSQSRDRAVQGYMDVSRNITRSKQEQQALQESKHFIQHILDATPNLLYLYDLEEDHLVYLNHIKNAAKHSDDGLPDSLQPDELRSIFHPADSSLPAGQLEQLRGLKDGETTEVEFRLKRSNRSYRWVSTRATVFSRQPGGAVQQIIGVAEDITKRKAAEKALRHRLELERLIAQISTHLINLPDAMVDQGIDDSLGMLLDFTRAACSYVYLFDPQNRHAHLSYHCCRHPGADDVHPSRKIDLSGSPNLLNSLHMSGILQIDMSEAARPDSREWKAAAVSKHAQSTILIPMEYNGRRLGFMGFDHTHRAKKWKPADIRMLKTIGEILINALTHKWGADALRESQTRYRAIVDDHQTEMICRFLQDTTLTFVNEAFCRHFGKPREEMQGTRIVDLLTPGQSETLLQKLSELSIHEPAKTSEMRTFTPTGAVCYQEWTDRAIYNEAGTLVEYQGVGRDITVRKKMEESLRDAQAKIAEQNRLAAIGQLASGVAHEINNPLTTIIAEAQMLLLQADRDPVCHDSAEAIVSAGWRAQQVVQQLLEFSEHSPNHNSRLSINRSVHNSILLVSSLVESSGIRLMVHLAEDLPPVQGNAQQLKELWIHLLLQKREPVPDRLPCSLYIQTALSPDGSHVDVEVNDNAQQIPDDQLRNIFEPMLNPKGAGMGSGFELSICREIIRQHQGRIEAHSSLNGTSFKVSLPAIIPAEE